MFKTETHMHTWPASGCGRIDPADIVRMYHEAGYTTVFVTNHWAQDQYDRISENLSWKEISDMHYADYEKAKKAGEQYGMHVLFCPEMHLGGNDYLLCGADRAFLDLRQDVFSLSLAEFYRYAKAYGITIIQAHPYRDDICFPTPEYVDAMEAVNAKPRNDNKNEQAVELAKKLGMPMTAGSDAHRPEDVGRAAVLSDEPIVSEKQYADLLLAGKLKLKLLDEIL